MKKRPHKNIHIKTTGLKTAAVDFNGKFVQTGSANYLIMNFS